jgi:hypothetical protein
LYGRHFPGNGGKTQCDTGVRDATYAATGLIDMAGALTDIEAAVARLPAILDTALAVGGTE